MTTEERYGQLWAAMARREGHRPGLPELAGKPSLGKPKRLFKPRAIEIDDLTAWLRANPGAMSRDIMAEFGVTAGQVKYTLQSVQGAHVVRRGGVSRWYVREDA